jgi:putative MFS transporter
MSLAGYWSNLFLGGVSVFFLMALINQFFGSGSYSIIGPYMAEIWPSRLRTSGMGLVYGVGNLGKFIGPAGLALIAGSSNFVSPQATLAALVPAMNYFAIWYFIGMFAAFYGVETRGRTIEEIDDTMSGAAPVLAAEKLPAR